MVGLGEELRLEGAGIELVLAREAEQEVGVGLAGAVIALELLDQQNATT